MKILLAAALVAASAAHAQSPMTWKLATGYRAKSFHTQNIAQLAREVEQVLSQYIKEPLVTVMPGGFVGLYSEQVRVVGEATEPQALPYRTGMTLLDVMIAVGGLTEFADGNKAVLSRPADGKWLKTVVRLDDLVRDGDIEANLPVQPGDVLLIPESWF